MASITSSIAIDNTPELRLIIIALRKLLSEAHTLDEEILKAIQEITNR